MSKILKPVVIPVLGHIRLLIIILLIKEPVLMDSVASEHGSERKNMHDQTSVEESVLQELEMVTSKVL